MNMMTVLGFTPWDSQKNLDELVPFCKKMGATDVAIMMMCHPEGVPLDKKIENYLILFSQARKLLKAEGINVGILLQTLQDHCDRGRPISPVKFQRTVDEYGKECSSCFCHLEADFQEYTRSIITMMAKESPDFILLEDEFRQWHESKACMCPLHVERFNHDTGSSFSREEIHEFMKSDSPEDTQLRNKWYESETSVILEFAQMVRNAIDLVDPSIKAGACCETSMLPLLERFIRTLAGNNPPFVRLCRAPYLENGHKDVPMRIATVATQRSFIPKDILCASEADTWNQSQYSTSMAGLRSFIIATQLMGTDFPHVWTTNIISESYQEALPYLNMLDSNKKFFDEVTQLSKKVDWMGPTVCPTIEEMLNEPWTPAPGGRPFVYNSLLWFEYCGRLGFPATICKDDEITMLSGNGCRSLPPEQIEKILATSVLLDAQAAIALTEMGYSDLLGVKATDDNELRFYFEKFSDNPEISGKFAGKMFDVGTPSGWTARLEIINPSVEVANWLMNCRWMMDDQYEKVSPGITLFENSKGGKVAVYSKKLMGSQSWMALSFFNKARRAQLERVLNWLGGYELPVVIDTTFDTFVLYGHNKNEDEDVMAVFDLNTDGLTPLPVRFAKGQPSNVALLNENGVWENVVFSKKGDQTILDVNLCTMTPLVFRIRF
ncbi:MAG: hypothetical protein KAR42_11295 [candidate division Zixibacteria bacterium]|nr:hypothetical protein [candidate division Zixibacteria bacterium]